MLFVKLYSVQYRSFGLCTTAKGSNLAQNVIKGLEKSDKSSLPLSNRRLEGMQLTWPDRIYRTVKLSSQIKSAALYLVLQYKAARRACSGVMLI